MPARRAPGQKHLFLHLSSREGKHFSFGCSQRGVSKKGVSGGACLLFPDASLLASEQGKEHPRNLGMKRLFRNAFSDYSKRWEKECDGRSLHGVPGPCSRVRPFFTCRTQRRIPQNFDMKRLIQKASSEHPILAKPRRGRSRTGRKHTHTHTQSEVDETQLFSTIVGGWVSFLEPRGKQHLQKRALCAPKSRIAVR